MGKIIGTFALNNDDWVDDDDPLKGTLSGAAFYVTYVNNIDEQKSTGQFQFLGEI